MRFHRKYVTLALNQLLTTAPLTTSRYETERQTSTITYPQAKEITAIHRALPNQLTNFVHNCLYLKINAHVGNICKPRASSVGKYGEYRKNIRYLDCVSTALLAINMANNRTVLNFRHKIQYYFSIILRHCLILIKE